MKRVALLLLVLNAPRIAFGAAIDLESLQTRSPFSAIKGGDTPATEEESALEFRGVLQENGVTLFSIFDKTKGTSSWLEAGEDAPVSVVSYDSGSESVVVRQNGKEQSLKLRTGEIVAGAPATTPNMPVAAIGTTGNRDADRLNSIAAEVMRRRALRRAATNNGTATPNQQQQPGNNTRQQPPGSSDGGGPPDGGGGPPGGGPPGGM